MKKKMNAQSAQNDPNDPNAVNAQIVDNAVVTAVRLRLVPWYRETAAALVACDSLMHAVGLLPRLRQLPSLDAVEVLLQDERGPQPVHRLLDGGADGGT